MTKKYKTLIDSNSKEFLHTINENNFAISDIPMLLNINSSFEDLKKIFPKLNFDSTRLIDITLTIDESFQDYEFF